MEQKHYGLEPETLYAGELKDPRPQEKNQEKTSLKKLREPQERQHAPTQHTARVRQVCKD